MVIGAKVVADATVDQHEGSKVRLVRHSGDVGCRTDRVCLVEAFVPKGHVDIAVVLAAKLHMRGYVLTGATHCSRCELRPGAIATSASEIANFLVRCRRVKEPAAQGAYNAIVRSCVHEHAVLEGRQIFRYANSLGSTWLYFCKTSSHHVTRLSNEGLLPIERVVQLVVSGYNCLE